MKLAIEEATKGIEAHDGGPFGSIIVKDGKIVEIGERDEVYFSPKDPYTKELMDSAKTKYVK